VGVPGQPDQAGMAVLDWCRIRMLRSKPTAVGGVNDGVRRMTGDRPASRGDGPNGSTCEIWRDAVLVITLLISARLQPTFRFWQAGCTSDHRDRTRI